MNPLPDCRTREPKGAVNHLGYSWISIFCANCGRFGGKVPEDNKEFAFYLCNACADKLPPIEGLYYEPDEEYWQRVHAAQMEKYGRILQPGEILVEMDRGSFPKVAKQLGG
jgi:hypothetical protein